MEFLFFATSLFLWFSFWFASLPCIFLRLQAFEISGLTYYDSGISWLHFSIWRSMPFQTFNFFVFIGALLDVFIEQAGQTGSPAYEKYFTIGWHTITRLVLLRGGLGGRFCFMFVLVLFSFSQKTFKRLGPPKVVPRKVVSAKLFHV